MGRRALFKMKTGIYVRVSTEEQASEGYSVRAQIEKLSAYAKIKEWPVFGLYSDEGISGKNVTERPGLTRLLADIEAGSVENVLVFKVDRLTRSTKDLIELIEFFGRHGCALNSLTEAIDTNSATGRMFVKIIGTFAEFERENMIERVKVGFERKAKEGYSLCGRTASYGYIREKGEKIQQIVPHEAAIVRDIFRLYVQDGLGLSKIARTLNDRGIPTKENALWSGTTVRLVLENVNYIGCVRHLIRDTANYTESPGLHEAIVDEALFYAAREKLQNMRRAARTKHIGPHAYFTGIAVCARCGAALSPKTTYKKKAEGVTHYPGYRCSGAAKGMCAAPTVSHLKLEAAFEAYLDRDTHLKARWLSLGPAERMGFLQKNIRKIVVFKGSGSRRAPAEIQAVEFYPL